MKKGLIIFLVIIFFFCLEGQAATTCYDNSNCSENQKCIRIGNESTGLCIDDVDLLDGENNVLEIIWPVNDDGDKNKVNLFFFEQYDKTTTLDCLSTTLNGSLGYLQEYSESDIAALQSLNEYELFSMISERYLELFEIEPWKTFADNFRIVQVNVNMYPDPTKYSRIQVSLKDYFSYGDSSKNLYVYLYNIISGGVCVPGGEASDPKIKITPVIAAVDFFFPSGGDPFTVSWVGQDKYKYLWHPGRLLSHELGHLIGVLDESYSNFEIYLSQRITHYGNNMFCPNTVDDGLYIKENASTYTLKYTLSCQGGLAPDCFYDQDGKIIAYDEESSYHRTTSDVVRDICYTCDVNDVNCTLKGNDTDGECIRFNLNGECEEVSFQPICDNLFGIRGYGNRVLYENWVKWMVWASKNEKGYPIEYLPTFFRIYDDAAPPYCFKPALLSNMHHSYLNFDFNVVDETLIRKDFFNIILRNIGINNPPFPGSDKVRVNDEDRYTVGVRLFPYDSSTTNYYSSSFNPALISNLSFDSNGESEFKIFNGVSVPDLEGLNSLVKNGTDIKVEWQVCWFTEDPITMPIKAKKRSEICHIVEKRTCGENNIYGCMESFKFHKKDFFRPVALSERSATNYITVKAVIKDYGDYKASYQDEGLSMYYRTRYIDQTCKTAVPFKEDNETVYPGLVSRTYSWHITTESLASQDLDCSTSSCAPFDRTDSDGDLVPDKCDIYPDCAGTSDSDGDGIADGCDNCPNIPNPVEMFEGNPFVDLSYGAKESGNGYWQPYGNLQNTYFWQPDHDLDGIGDACDLKTDPDAMGYSTSHPWRHFGKAAQNWQGEFFDFFEMNSTVGIHVAGGYYGSDEVSSPVTGIIRQNGGSHRVHYCGLDLAEYCATGVNGDKTGCESSLNDWAGKCETSTENGKTFGRSHATTTVVSANGRERWPHIAWGESSSKAKSFNYSHVDEHKNSISTASVFWPYPVAYWNWRADIYAQYGCDDDDNADLFAICENTSGGIRENTPVYYDLSSNYVGNSDQYLINNNTSVNPEYFKNYATRSDNSDYDQVGKWAMATRLNKNPMVVKYKRSALLTPDELKDSYKSFINQIMWKDEAPNILFSPYSLIFDELDFVKYQTVGFLNSGSVSYSITESSIPVLSHMRQIISGDISGVTYSVAKYFDDDDTYSLFVNYAPSSDWHKMGVISNYSDYDLEWSSATVHNRTIYIAAIEDVQSTVGKNLYRIVRDGDNFIIEPVMIIPIDGSQIRVISALGKLYVISDNDGVFSTLAVNPETEKSTLINSEINPSFIRPLNIIGTETGIYIAGKYDPADQNNTIVAKLSDNNGWQIIHSGINADTDKLIMDVINGRIIMTNIISDSDMTTRIELDLNDDTINIADIEPFDIYGIEERGDTYCLNETDNIVKGGLEMSGECMPFTHPWYRSFATGSTIYSVAGKGDRLYVGTNNSIKVYDISDPEAFVLKSTFSTGGRIVYDLEVADDDVMYAATSGGLYKLDTANPDTLSSLSFFTTSYNYQYRIQLYNDKLYVGDDNGINIRDKETFARLAYVNIDSVLDFAIANGEIALYRSSFWSAGLHIRDVNTLNLKAYEYAECYTGELTTDHGAFYLSCDGYEYRFEGRPDTYIDFYSVVGDMLEMQENHVYNGWTYIPDGSSVKLSTLNDVPGYCGNGVIEEGELCDGNSVACTTLDPDYVSGTAYCNSTCDGYNEGNCEEDGW